MRYIYKIGNRTDDYKVGELLRMKWHKLYKIIKVTYNYQKDQTSIKLSEDCNA